MGAADVVFYAPPGELLAEADEHVEDLRAHPNPAAKKKATRKRRRRRDWWLDEAAIDWYGDWHTLLVRTALIRARGFDPRDKPRVGSFQEVLPHVEHLKHLNYEMVLTFCLDARNRLNGIHEAAKGGLHGAGVTPKDVLIAPLLTASSGFIMVHNHPSGDPTPSPDDIAMTRALAEAAATIGLTFLDHVVVGTDGATSLHDYGVFD